MFRIQIHKDPKLLPSRIWIRIRNKLMSRIRIRIRNYHWGSGLLKNKCSDKNTIFNIKSSISAVFRIRIRPDPKLFGLKDPDPDPKLLISDQDPAPNQDPSLFHTKLRKDVLKMNYKVKKFIIISYTILEKSKS